MAIKIETVKLVFEVVSDDEITVDDTEDQCLGVCPAGMYT